MQKIIDSQLRELKVRRKQIDELIKIRKEHEETIEQLKYLNSAGK